MAGILFYMFWFRFHSRVSALSLFVEPGVRLAVHYFAVYLVLESLKLSRL